ETGTRVTLTGLGTSGHVVAKPRRGQVTVAVGAMKTTVSVDALSLAAGGARVAAPLKAPPKANERKRKGEAAAAVPERGPDPLRTPVNTVNLVGQRVEPALERLDSFIDGLLRIGEPVGFVLHGHGTGALRSAVREHLSQHRCVARAEAAGPDDGGDAFTVLWLG
ncbi:MAG TPA: Smr/MutS family protein, partial [Polyangiaceae bacterium]|nr:Smr/MutS family protein [Polyangiaceae bacterium]